VSSFIDLTEFGVTAHTPNTSDTHLFIGGGHYAGRDFNCKISEVRISDINRSNAWLKTDYYSMHDDLITFGLEELEPVYYYHGYVKEYGQPVSRIVKLYNRSTGALMDTDVSRVSDGYYYLTTTISGLHFIVTFDNDVGAEFNALILDKLSPRGIE
jgi:hypothetical protein